MKHPLPGGTLHFDNGWLKSLLAYQAGTDREAVLAEMVDLTQQRALTLIRFHNTTKYRAEEELLSDINCKLIRAVDTGCCPKT
jgi:hypothetical protein